MDAGCITLSILLLIQMSVILTMLNPAYDVRKIILVINGLTNTYEKAYNAFIIFYFTAVSYLGMFIPLQSIRKLIFSANLMELEKTRLLHSVRKNYIIAGFSLFLLVAMYGIRSLLSYTASLALLTDNQRTLIKPRSNSREKQLPAAENILPNLLRVKRSISYETVLFTKEIRDQLKVIIKSVEQPQDRATLYSILAAGNITS